VYTLLVNRIKTRAAQKPSEAVLARRVAADSATARQGGATTPGGFLSGSLNHYQGNAMGLSTHVLDTMHGTPAGGMKVSLYTTHAGEASLVKSFTLNDDGRNPDGLLYDSATLKAGTYRLVFDVAATSRRAA
jgi:hypothetical protein